MKKWMVVALVMTAGVLGAQSLGDIARKMRAEKQGAPKARPNRVYNNDTIPKYTTLAREDEKPSGEAAAKDKEAEAKKPAAGRFSAEEEKAWKSKFAKMREDLAYEERKLDVLQRELNLAQIQAYSDPNQALREQFQRTEVTKRTAEIEQQKQKVEAAKKAIADGEEELRRKGLPAGWALP